uniref:C-type lectin domain-containing protein n=1 Tax=Oryzias melastigma TaxID=30732 RepID=A0A3B3BK77_ORYME
QDVFLQNGDKSSSQCPRGWLASGRSCYSVRTSALSWSGSQSSCRDLAPGGHLADMKSLEDLLFVSSHVLTDNLVLMWTGLNDQQVTSYKSLGLTGYQIIYRIDLIHQSLD